MNKNVLTLIVHEENVKNLLYCDPCCHSEALIKENRYLERPKVYPLERVVSSTKRGKKWLKVWVNISKANRFTSSVTSQTYKINYRLNCDKNCLIYFLIV